MIPMSTKEIKDFWHGFCQRRNVDPALRAAGDRRIEEDPEYWADHTMTDLLEEVTRRSTP
jgi:hypothetical protein